MKANKKMIFRRKLVAVAVASCFTVMPAFANPIGATVVNGQVGFATQGSTLTVTNSPNSIINWQQFSINTGETTRFVQQSAQSAVLNRVVGQNPSQLLGSLLSNGRVYLINPNGILFGQGAVIDVGGLVASTLKLTDGDFLAGRLNFTDGVGAGGINNQGSITTPAGGNVYLIAPDITNSGVITSPQGEILLAAGHTVNLMDTTNPNVQVTVGAPDTQAVNIGSLIARSGKVGIYGALIDQQGLVDANTAVVGANGKVTLRASKDITLEPGSVTTASGMAGGVKDGGEIRIIADGKLNVRQGSEVHVDGGVDGGNGGFLELSGKTGFSLMGAYTGRAQKSGYRNGSLLLDPTNININSGCGASPSSGCLTPAQLDPGGFGTVSLLATTDISVNTAIGNSDINSGLAGGYLTLTAGNNITVGAQIGAPSTAGRFNHDLTLTAGNNVNINNSIYLGNNLLTLAANADGVGGGDVVISPPNTFWTAASIVVDTQGGLNVSGVGLQVLGHTPPPPCDCYFYNAPVTVNVGGNFTANLTGAMLIEAGAAANSFNSTNVDNSVSLNVTGVTNITAASLDVRGGSAHAVASGSNNYSAKADALLHGTGAITVDVTGGVTVQGGNANTTGSSISADGGFSAIASATAELSGVGSVTIKNASSVMVSGGDNATAIVASNPWWGTYMVEAHADALLSAGGALTMTNVGGLTVQGGNNAYAKAYNANNSESYSAAATANASVQANTMDITLTGPLLVKGGNSAATLAGDSGNGSHTSGHNTATTNTDALISASGLLNINSTTGLTVQGGGVATSVSGSGINAATAAAKAAVQGSSKLYITTTGTINLTPGSVATVGGNVDVSARVEASPYTIYVTFPNLTSGGYFVNGVEGGPLVPTSTGSLLTDSGFFTGGTPAVLNSTMFVTYLGSALTDQVLGAVGFGANELNNSNTFDAFFEPIRFGEEHEDNKNEKPVCR